MFGRILKRFCHHHDKNIAQFLKPYNPLVECEKAYNTTSLKNTSPPSIKETKTYIENNIFIYNEISYLPIPIQIQHVYNIDNLYTKKIYFEK
jgi:hypothetical protein